MSDYENPNMEEVMEEAEEATEPRKTFWEELEVAGNQLVREVERLIREGNIRRLIIKRDDEVLFQVNLTLGVAGAGAIAIFAPWSAVILAAVAAVAAAVAKVTIAIERFEEEESAEEDEEAQG